MGHEPLITDSIGARQHPGGFLPNARTLSDSIEVGSELDGLEGYSVPWDFSTNDLLKERRHDCGQV